MNLKLQKKIEYDPLMVTNNFGGKSDEVEMSGLTNSYLSREDDRYRSESLEEGTTPIGVVDSLTEELQSVALDWKSVRGVKECPCSAPLDFATRKVIVQHRLKLLI